MAVRTLRLVPMLAAVLITCAGCGTSATQSHAASPDNPNALATTPRTLPENFTTVGQLSTALHGVATCTPAGGPVLFCSLVTATSETFLVRVFTTPAATAVYLVTIHAQDAVASRQGETPRGALRGPTWVAVPKVTAPNVLPTLQSYLGGSLFV